MKCNCALCKRSEREASAVTVSSRRVVTVPTEGTYLVVDGVVRQAREEFGHGGRLYTAEVDNDE